MFENILALLIAALVVLGSTSAQKCTVPVQEALAPCYCDESFSLIGCGGEDSADVDLKAVFERASLLVDDSVVFNRLGISFHWARELPAGLTGSLKFNEVLIEWNGNLSYIHPDAFNSTYETTTSLSLGHNALVSDEENSDLWTVINRFRNLEYFGIRMNRITHIPDDPFPQEMPRLKSFQIDNWLERVGARFLANLPALEEANLATCGLTLDKLTPATFEGIASPNVQLSVTYNKDITRLPQEIFKPALDSAAVVYVGGVECLFISCDYIRHDCDSGIDWVCEDVDFYEPRLDGYYCKYGHWDHIWEYCASLNANSTSQ